MATSPAIKVASIQSMTREKRPCAIGGAVVEQGAVTDLPADRLKSCLKTAVRCKQCDGVDCENNEDCFSSLHETAPELIGDGDSECDDADADHGESDSDCGSTGRLQLNTSPGLTGSLQLKQSAGPAEPLPRYGKPKGPLWCDIESSDDDDRGREPTAVRGSAEMGVDLHADAGEGMAPKPTLYWDFMKPAGRVGLVETLGADGLSVAAPPSAREQKKRARKRAKRAGKQLVTSDGTEELCQDEPPVTMDDIGGRIDRINDGDDDGSHCELSVEEAHCMYDDMLDKVWSEYVPETAVKPVDWDRVSQACICGLPWETFLRCWVKRRAKEAAMETEPAGLMASAVLIEPASPPEAAGLLGSAGLIETAVLQESAGQLGSAGLIESAAPPESARLLGSAGLIELVAQPESAGLLGSAGLIKSAAPLESAGLLGSAVPPESAGLLGSAEPTKSAVPPEPAGLLGSAGLI